MAPCCANALDLHPVVRRRSFYVGSAHDLDARLAQHAIGSADAYTAKRRPITLVWALESDRVDEAWALERKIKGWRRDKRIALIEGCLTDLPRLSRSGSHSESA